MQLLYEVDKENCVKIISFLMILVYDSARILEGEIRSWSLLSV